MLASTLAIGLMACGNGTKKGTGNGPGGTTDAATITPAMTKCNALRDHVAGLYKKSEPPDKDAKKQKRREMVMADNVTMVLTDCAKNAAGTDKTITCIKAATTVDQLERECVSKLDDAGRVEGDYFKKNP